MKKGLFIVLLMGIFLAGSVAAQNKNDGNIFVKSWKTGSEQIVEQKFDVTLSNQNPEFSQTVFGQSGNRYRLQIIHLPDEKSKESETGRTTESWRVELRQITFNKENKEILSPNLIDDTPPGQVTDFFTRDIYAGYLYPKTTSRMKINGNPLIDGYTYFPIGQPRRIQVENFYVDLKVTDYRLNDRDVHKVDFLRVVIEFKNK